MSVLRRQTHAFINSNLISIRLTRYSKTSTTAGGWTLTKVAELISQDARLVFSSNKNQSVTRVLPDGRVVIVDATLVMLPDADVEVGDEFEYDGKTWVVGSIQKTINESLNAGVGARG